jgi:hypothetical protein
MHRYLFAFLLPALVSVPAFLKAPQATNSPTCQFFVLTRTPEVALKLISLQEGQVQVFPVQPGSENLTLVLPPAPGQSGNLIRAGDKFLLTGRCVEGEVRVQVQEPDGTSRPYASVKMADLASYDIRVGVVGGDGKRRSFLLSGREPAEVDESGPTLDLFRGRIPLQTGDYIVTTDTARRQQRRSLEGHSPLDELSGWMAGKGRIAGGGEGHFIVDTAAGRTLVGKALLGPEAEIQPTRMTEYSARGTRLLESKAKGAGGEISAFLGETRVKELRLGEIIIPSVTVGVLADMAAATGVEAAGIFGIDMMRQAEVVRISYPSRKGKLGELRFSKGGRPQHEPALRMPFHLVGSHIFLRGELQGAPIFFVLDTGSRDSFLSLATAQSAGLIGDANAEKQIRGADGQPISVRPGVVKKLRIGAGEFSDVSFFIGDLPVLKGLGVVEPVGILGNSFIRRWGSIELDFVQKEVRFYRGTEN